MATKINNILQQTPKNSLLLSSWLVKNSMQTKEISLCVRNGWLERIAQGVYFRVGDTPGIFTAVSSYNNQLDKHCHIGASTALDLRGFSHFVAMGKQTAYLFTPTAERLPSWLLSYSWDMEVRYFTTKIFSQDSLGIEAMEVNGVQLLVSSPERAFMESLYLSPTYFSLMDIYYVMEMLTTLRPKILQQLLENCSSVKVNRLFMYTAEKANHQWFRVIDASRIDFGEGKRSLAKGGVYNSKYKITIPTELDSYE